MKHLALLAVCLLTLTLSAQIKEPNKPPNFPDDFAKLPPNEQAQWQMDFKVANHHFKQKNIKGCLALLNSLNKRIRTNPAVHNLEGACHVENRDFKKAVSAFRKAHLYDPKNLNVAFNLAEVEFVTRDYKMARIHFEQVRKKFKAADQAHLEVFCRYKVFLCHLMLDDNERIAKAHAVIQKKHPKGLISYYSQCAAAMKEKNLDQAGKWLAKAEKDAEGDPSIYKDALVELGYMNKNFELELPE